MIAPTIKSAGGLHSVGVALSLPARLAPGETILLNLDGTSRRYRVLRQSAESDTVYTIMTQFDIGSNSRFNTSTSIGNNYAGSTLQTVMENWYNGLPAASQAAIQAVSLNAYKYVWGSSYEYSTKSLGSTAANQHVYPLDLEDIHMYFGGTGGSATDKTPGTFTGKQLREMFGIEYNEQKTLWLRSGDAGVSTYALTVNHAYAGDSASVSSDQVDHLQYKRGMMVIDLANLEYTREARPHSVRIAVATNDPNNQKCLI